MNPHHKVEVKRPSHRSTNRSENFSGGLGGPFSCSDDWCDGSLGICHCNCTDQHLLSRQSTQSKPLLAGSEVFLGQETLKMLTSASQGNKLEGSS